MNISSTPAVQAATSGAQSDTADGVNILVLKKALDLQATSALALALALALLQALPQPALATQGTVGTRINTFA